MSLTDFKSKFEVERKDTDSYNSSTTSGSQQQQHPPPLLPLPTPPHPFSSSSSSSAGVSGAGGVPIATLAHLPDSTTDSWSSYYGAQRQDGVGKPFNSKNTSLKQRCRDYDGRNRVTHFFFFNFDTRIIYSVLVNISSSILSPISNLHIAAVALEIYNL